MFYQRQAAKNAFSLVGVFVAFQCLLEGLRSVHWFIEIRDEFDGLAKTLLLPRSIYSSSPNSKILGIASEYSLTVFLLIFIIGVAYLGSSAYSRVVSYTSPHRHPPSGYVILGCCIILLATVTQISGQIEYLGVTLISCLVGNLIVKEKNKLKLAVIVLLFLTLYYLDPSSRFPLLIVILGVLISLTKKPSLIFFYIFFVAIAAVAFIDYLYVNYDPAANFGLALVHEIKGQMLRAAVLTSALDASSLNFEIYSNNIDFIGAWIESVKPRYMFPDKMILAFPKDFSAFVGYENSFWLSPGIFIYADRKILFLFSFYFSIYIIFILGLHILKKLNLHRYLVVWLIYFNFILIISIEANPFFIIPGMLKFLVMLAISASIYDRLERHMIN